MSKNKLTPSLERQLGTDAAEILKLHREIVEEGGSLLQKAIRCGGFLWRAKEELDHGEWLPWCAKNLPNISERTIQNYMACFKKREMLQGSEINDLSKAYKAIAAPKPDKPKSANVADLTSGNPNKEGNSTGESPGGDAPPPAPAKIVIGKPVEVFDQTGFLIPDPSPAMKTWLRSDEVDVMLTGLSRIRSTVRRAQEDKDPLYYEVNFSAFLADAGSVYQLLKVGVPYAVCPTCQGRVLSPCKTCGGRGMVSEFYWKHKVPEETKKIREKAIAMRKGNKK